MSHSMTNGRLETASGFAVRLFRVLVLVFGVTAALATALISLLPVLRSPGVISLPWAFWVSSGFLFLNSLMQHRAVEAVRWERQRTFRRCLFLALVSGVGFVSVQAYGLWCLIQDQPTTSEAASTGPEAFVFVLTMLHAMHVSVAIMFLTYVFLKSRMDRYDHEYHWGVVCCAWFWHALALVWVAIIAVFLIAT